MFINASPYCKYTVNFVGGRSTWLTLLMHRQQTELEVQRRPYANQVHRLYACELAQFYVTQENTVRQQISAML